MKCRLALGATDTDYSARSFRCVSFAATFPVRIRCQRRSCPALGHDLFLAVPSTAASRGVVDFERSVVISSDVIAGVAQDASSNCFAPSTSFASPSSGSRSSSAMDPRRASAARRFGWPARRIRFGC